jgi:O-acetylhomoserine/O-acetylserine sulfhydrylase-like pyridoxal-dependent enzyme
MGIEHIDRNLGFSTRQLHSGHTPDIDTGSRAVPIYQTTSFQFESTEHAANGEYLYPHHEPDQRCSGAAGRKP